MIFSLYEMVSWIISFTRVDAFFSGSGIIASIKFMLGVWTVLLFRVPSKRRLLYLFEMPTVRICFAAPSQEKSYGDQVDETEVEIKSGDWRGICPN